MIRFRSNLKVDLVYKAMLGNVDCRLMFLGDHQRQLIRLFEEISYRLQRTQDPETLYRSLTRSAEVLQFYDVQRNDGVVSLRLHDDVFMRPGPMEEVQIEIRVSDKKRTWTHPLPLENLPAIGNLFPLLRGGHSEHEIHTRLSERLTTDQIDWALELVAKLKERSFLTNDPNGKIYSFEPPEKPAVTFLGHSSLLFQSKLTSVLVDPFLREERGLPTRVTDIVHAKLGAICCSHSHWDHCHMSSLIWFDKDIPILIPKVVEPSGFNPPVATVLRKLGFTDIREVEHWEQVTIGDIQIIPVPFYGEQEEPDIRMDHYTYILKTDGLCVYGGVDAYKDSFGDMKPVLKRVREEYSPDIAFLPISNVVFSNRHGGPNAYCRSIDSDSIKADYQYTASPEEAAEWVEILNPKKVVPYAVFTFSRWNTPREIPPFSSALKKLKLQDRLLPLRTLDSLSSADLRTSVASDLRRKLRLVWFEQGASIAHHHHNLQKRSAAYRFLGKVTRKLAGSDSR